MAKTRMTITLGSYWLAAAILGGCYSTADSGLPASAATSTATAAATAAPGGEALYFNHCASCHGANAEGGGPVASVMQVNVPNLRNLAARNGGRFPTEAVRAYVDGRSVNAAHGERVMPVWGDVFRAAGAGNDAAASQRIAALVDFIAEVQYPQ
jgi:mono/diheme cytochrome c family protein